MPINFGIYKHQSIIFNFRPNNLDCSSMFCINQNIKQDKNMILKINFNFVSLFHKSFV